MQRYGYFGQNTNILVFSWFVCCDRVSDLRQRGGMVEYFVGRAIKRPLNQTEKTRTQRGGCVLEEEERGMSYKLTVSFFRSLS
ncbi:hypothetical protein SAMN04487902_103167 [Prevotella sp. ne3005]|nr:hypothetical protein SAMN04487902_103167 [Prevotella sp. ne3005]